MAPGSEHGEDVLEAGGDGAAFKAAMESWLDPSTTRVANYTIADCNEITHINALHAIRLTNTIIPTSLTRPIPWGHLPAGGLPFCTHLGVPNRCSPSFGCSHISPARLHSDGEAALSHHACIHSQRPPLHWASAMRHARALSAVVSVEFYRYSSWLISAPPCTWRRHSRNYQAYALTDTDTGAVGPSIAQLPVTVSLSFIAPAVRKS